MASKLSVAKRIEERKRLINQNIKAINAYNTYNINTLKTYQNVIDKEYDYATGRACLYDKISKSKVYINQNLGYKEQEDAIRALVRAREDDVTQDQVLQRLTNNHVEPQAVLHRDVVPDRKGWLVPAETVKLSIDPDLRERGIHLLRLALSKPTQTITVARQVREILGMNFIGNLPWEAAPDWETCKALKDLGLFERKGALEYKLAHGGNDARDLKLSTQLDANGQSYTDVHFSITEAGRNLITALNQADPSYMVAANHTLVGEAGMRALHVLFQYNGTMEFMVPLDLFDTDRRLQKLINLEVIRLNNAQIHITDRNYLTSLTLTAKGAQMVKLAVESGWTGWSMAPWETQREAKAAKYFIEMISRVEDEVIDYQAQAVVMPQIASTRRGRGGFGMTARRFGGQVGERTDFRWVGRKATQSIELWQPEIEDAEFEEVRAVSQGNVALGTTVKMHVYTTATTATNNGTVVSFPHRMAGHGTKI